MTEREKMLAGKIYKPFGDGLAGERALAHKLCAEYNQTSEVDERKREDILNTLLPNRVEGVYLQGPIFF